MKIRQPFPETSPEFWDFFCPGCQCTHRISTKIWSLTGPPERPTIRFSVLCNEERPESRCHSFVTDGEVHFLNDCHHELAGKTVPLEDVEP